MPYACATVFLDKSTTHFYVCFVTNISDASEVTAGNIEEQIGMTQNIQTAITDTKQRSEKIVTIATTSNETILENQHVMVELTNQSEVMTETNQQVTEAMDKFRNKTKEVETIAGMILNISSQTNLLALNASIESAVRLDKYTI